MIPWFATLASAAPPAMPKLEMPAVVYDLDAYEMCYPSGLLVHVVRRPESDVVAIGTVVGGGTSVETPETRGAAHLVEHLWFRSRPGGGPRPWDLAAGLDVQGTTHADNTVYTTVGGPEDLPALLALEVQRLVDPLQGIDQAQIDGEARAVASEIAWRDENGNRAAHRLLDTQLWPGDHPYASSLSGAELRTIDELRAYVAASYRPERTSIRIEGDVDPNNVSAVLESLLPPALIDGAVTSCARTPPPATPPAPRTNELARISAPVWRPRLYLAWSMPAGWGADDQTLRYAVAYLEDALGDAMWNLPGVRDQRDFRRSCTFEPGLLASTAVCTVEVPTVEAAVQAYTIIPRQLDSQWGFEDDFYRRRLLGELASETFLDGVALLDGYDADSVAQKALSTWLGRIDPTTRIVDQARRIDHPQVANLAEVWLRQDRTVGVLLVPEEARVADPGPVASGTPEPIVVPPWHPGAPELPVTAERLENGLDTWVVRRPDAPWLARASVISAGGWASSPVPGASEVMFELERYVLPISLDELRAKVAVSTFQTYGSTSHAETVWTPAANLDLALWTERATNTKVMDFSERQAGLDRSLAYWLHLATLADPSPVAASLRERWLLPSDRAGMPWWDRMDAARHVLESQVRAWQRTVRRPSNSVLVVESPLDPALVRGDASRMLGRWKDRGKPLPVVLPALPAPPARKTMVIPTATSGLTDVELTCRLPGRTDTNAAAHQVLRALLYDDLFRTLREGASVYRVDVGLEPVDPRVALLTLQATTLPSQAGATAATMQDTLARVAAGPAPALLGRGRLAAEGEVARGLASAAGTFGLLSDAAAEGRTLDGVRRLRADVGAVDAPALAELLRDCVGHEATTIIGPVPTAVEGERVDWVAMGEDLTKRLR